MNDLNALALAAPQTETLLARVVPEFDRIKGELANTFDARQQSLEQIVARPGFKIDSEALKEWATAWLHTMAADNKLLDGVRKLLVGPPGDVVSALNAEFMPRIKRSKDLKDLVARRIADYIDAQAKQKAAAMAAAAEAHLAGEHALAQQALAIANVAATGAAKVVGTTIKKVWKYRVINAAIVPREWCDPSETRLNQHAREATEEPTPISGVEFYQDIQTTVRTK